MWFLIIITEIFDQKKQSYLATPHAVNVNPFDKAVLKSYTI